MVLYDYLFTLKVGYQRRVFIRTNGKFQTSKRFLKNLWRIGEIQVFDSDFGNLCIYIIYVLHNGLLLTNCCNSKSTSEAHFELIL